MVRLNKKLTSDPVFFDDDGGLGLFFNDQVEYATE
jgi:hypothetical protein